MNSASVVEVDTVECLRLAQLTAAPFNTKTRPDVDLRESMHPA
jgi:hypothetical protein